MLKLMANSVDTNLVSLRGISKSFKEPLRNPLRSRKSIPVLVSVDLDIPEGSVTCLIGPNGAGKTTLIKILSHLITADSGTMLQRGNKIELDGRGGALSIGLVTPNERSFYWRLTGRDNLHFFGALHGLRGSALRERASEVLEETGMIESADKPYRLYSAGMKQKMNIARSLLGSPELFLLDEPAAHLDPLAREGFWDFIETVLIKKRRATVLLCTHDLEEARRLADRVVILDSGRVVAAGDAGRLGEMIDSRKEFVLRYSGTLPGPWMARWEKNLIHEGSGTVRLLLDERETPREEAIRDLIESGGVLREFYAAEDDLLRLLRRKVGSL